MEANILMERENPLFSRKEIILEITADVTLSKDEAKRVISEKFSSDESLIRIRVIKGKFGSRVFSVVADIYDSVNEFNRVVKKTKQEIEAEKKAEEERLKAEEEARLVAEQAAEASESGEGEKE
jgi:ribosomal protein S24E